MATIIGYTCIVCGAGALAWVFMRLVEVLDR
jgi:hypothetical protein